MRPEFLINQPEIYACSSCDWTGKDPAVTESKEVDSEGNVTRQWHAICPSCHSAAINTGKTS